MPPVTVAHITQRRFTNPTLTLDAEKVTIFTTVCFGWTARGFTAVWSFGVFLRQKKGVSILSAKTLQPVGVRTSGRRKPQKILVKWHLNPDSVAKQINRFDGLRNWALMRLIVGPGLIPCDY